jgi:ABC-type sugar transport system ATPase subunit
MNLLRGRCRGGEVTAGDLRFQRPGVADQDVVVGIRPEALTRACDGLPHLDLEVAVVEPLGDEVVVHGSVQAELANVAREETETGILPADGRGSGAVARLDPRDPPREGSVIRLGMEPDRAYLFNAASGRAIA